jgi:fructose-1,6-bisphosphatase/inositol monophosphatase family enzyme
MPGGYFKKCHPRTLSTDGGMVPIQALAMSTVPSWVRKVPLGMYSAEAEVAADLALRCGAAMRSTTAALRTATLKDGEDKGIDPVTQTDVDNEALVQSGLLARFPQHALIGEESAAAAGSIPAVDPSMPTWVVDPIDGTQNFVHGLPLSCVSIGLCVGGKPTLGVVYDPYRDELFIGVAESTEHASGPAAGVRAAYLNGERIQADATIKSLEKAIVGTDPGYERTPQGIARIAAAQSGLLGRNVFALRVLGSSVLSVAYVACGRANGFYSGLAKRDCPKPWDWCAAAAIGEASGVVFRRFDSASGFQFEAPTGLCCAGSVELADALEETLREATGGKPMG